MSPFSRAGIWKRTRSRCRRSSDACRRARSWRQRSSSSVSSCQTSSSSATTSARSAAASRLRSSVANSSSSRPRSSCTTHRPTSRASRLRFLHSSHPCHCVACMSISVVIFNVFINTEILMKQLWILQLQAPRNAFHCMLSFYYLGRGSGWRIREDARRPAGHAARHREAHEEDFKRAARNTASERYARGAAARLCRTSRE